MESIINSFRFLIQKVFPFGNPNPYFYSGSDLEPTRCKDDNIDPDLRYCWTAGHYSYRSFTNTPWQIYLSLLTSCVVYNVIWLRYHLAYWTFLLILETYCQWVGIKLVLLSSESYYITESTDTNDIDKYQTAWTFHVSMLINTVVE